MDKVTVDNLSAALRAMDHDLEQDTVRDIIEVIKMIEDKGDGLTIKELIEFKEKSKENKIGFIK